MPRRSCRLEIVLSLALLVPCGPLSRAVAQDAAASREAPAQEAAMARTLFMQGARAAKEGDWARARDAFAASYELRASPRTLFNLGIARVELGELVAGSEALRAFLRDAEPSREADNIAIARRELARVEPQIAHVRIDAAEAGSADQLEVDGRLLPRGAIGTELPLDPGSHRIRWLKPERVVAEQRIEVQPGEHTTLALEPSAEPEPVAAPAVIAPVEPPSRPSESAPALATSPLPARKDEPSKRKRRWIIGGSVAALVLGGAATAFVLLRDRKEEREELAPVESNVTNEVLRVP
jgi:hypothetical protein